MFYEKYLKYKAKYAGLKRKLSIDDPKCSIEFFDEGAESRIFRIKDGVNLGKVLKVSKKYEIGLKRRKKSNKDINFLNHEEKVTLALSNLNSINYPKVYYIGLFKSEDQIIEETKSISMTGDGDFKYRIAVMDEIVGHNMMTIFYLEFQNYLLLEPINLLNLINLDDPNLTKLIEQFSNMFYVVVLKLCIALHLAYIGLNFRHHDFELRNCIIKNYNTNNPIPVIIDFGISTISKKSNVGSECKDIMGFINTSLSGANCNCCKIIDKNFNLSQVNKNKMIENCKALMEKIKKNPKIKKILDKIADCKPHLNEQDIKLQDFIDYLQRNL